MGKHFIAPPRRVNAKSKMVSSIRKVAMGSKKKFKVRVRVRTGSKTKSKRSHEIVVKPPPSGLSHSYHSLSYRPDKTVRMGIKITEPATYEYYLAGAATSLWNRQQANTTLNLFKGDVINAVYNQEAQWLNAAGATQNNNQQSSQSSYKFLLQDVTAITSYVNQENTGVEIEIYDCMSKVTREDFTTPVDDWTAGLVDQKLAHAAATPYAPFAVPTTSKYFNINWNILKRSKVELGPGRSHEHVFKFSPQRIVDLEYAAKYNVIRGITCAQFIVVRGMLADGGAADVTNIGFSTAKVDYLTRYKYTTRILSFYPRQSFQDLSGLPAAPQTQTIVNEGSGLIAALAAA